MATTSFTLAREYNLVKTCEIIITSSPQIVLWVVIFSEEYICNFKNIILNKKIFSVKRKENFI